jgi:hypothetical protein
VTISFTPFTEDPVPVHPPAVDLAGHLSDTVDAHDATAVSHAGSGTSPAANVELALARIRGQWIDVRDYGAVGDGSTNDSAAILAAMNAVDGTKGGVVVFPGGPGTVYMAANVTIPSKQKLTLYAPGGATIKKNANGPIFTTPGSGWGQYLTFLGLHLDGNGANYTGTGITVGASSAWMRFHGGSIVDTASYCISFATADGGAQCSVGSTTLKVYLGQAGEANENVAAIYLPLDVGAPNRAFFDIQTDNCLLFEDAGSQNTSWVGCHARNISITGDPAKLFLSACRLASAGVATTLRGTQNMYTGNAFAGSVTLGATSTNATFTGNVIAGDLTLAASSSLNKVAGNTYTGTLSDSGLRNNISQHDGTVDWPCTFDPRFLAATTTLNANQAVYLRVRGRGLISKIGLHVGVASGNIAVAVYSNNGDPGRSARPTTRKATSGSVACPAAGYAEVSLGASVYVDDGDWFVLVADNTTASFYRAGAGGFSSTIANGYSHHESSAFPPPATATVSTGAVFSVVLVGVA